jgi:multiple sugar transport system permease protein
MEVQLFEVPIKFLPNPLTIKNYRDVLADGSMITYMGNSLIIAMATTIVTLVTAIPAAYSLARYNYPSRGPINFLIITLRIVPGVTFILPYFQIIRAMRLVNTRLALLLTYVPGALVLAVIMLRNFFMEFPRDIEDAGRIDGLNAVGIIIQLLIPVSLPIISTTSLLSFLGAWNEYLYASVLIRTPNLKTMPMGIDSYVSTFQIYWGKLMANGIIYVLPVIIFTVLAQKGLVKGLMAGAIKE